MSNVTYKKVPCIVNVPITIKDLETIQMLKNLNVTEESYAEEKIKIIQRENIYMRKALENDFDKLSENSQESLLNQSIFFKQKENN